MVSTCLSSRLYLKKCNVFMCSRLVHLLDLVFHSLFWAPFSSFFPVCFCVCTPEFYSFVSCLRINQPHQCNSRLFLNLVVNNQFSTSFSSHSFPCFVFFCCKLQKLQCASSPPTHTRSLKTSSQSVHTLFATITLFTRQGFLFSIDFAFLSEIISTCSAILTGKLFTPK